MTQPNPTDNSNIESRNDVFESTRSKRLPCECCGKSDFLPLLLRDDETLVVRCKSCQLEFVNPLPETSIMENSYQSKMVSADPDQGYFSEYILERQKREKSFSRLYNKRLRLIETYNPNKGNLLDLGCGAGFFVKSAIDRGWNGHGLELLPEYVQYAQEKLGIPQIIQGSLDDSLSFDAGTFDVITLWDLIEHLRHPLTCLKKINRVTKPGGHLVIWTPNVKNSIFVKEQWLSYGIHQHFYFFSKNSLQQILNKAGFKIKYLKTNKSKKGLFNRNGTQPFKENNKPDNTIGKLYYSIKRDMRNTLNPLTYVGPLFDLAGYGFNLFIIASKTHELY